MRWKKVEINFSNGAKHVQINRMSNYLLTRVASEVNEKSIYYIKDNPGAFEQAKALALKKGLIDG